MKLVIMSDTHGDCAIIEKIISYYPSADYYIHCGDSELPENDDSLKKFIKVGGNCDHDAAYANDVLLDIGKRKLYVTHGHLFNVKSNMMTLSYRAEEVGAHVVCFGHSHILGVEKINDILFINPGSLKMPRGRNDKTFVTLEIQEDQCIIKCLNENNDLLDKFYYNI